MSQIEPSRILVVDDDPETVRLLRSWFGERFEFLEAGDGNRGFDLAMTGSPDVILLDLTMPGDDGITVARRLKSEPATRTLPVILLTACRDIEAKVEAFSAGVDDYVTKPFELEEVGARIESMLRRRETFVQFESTVRGLEAEKGQLEELLMVDEKTGLYNFRHFQRRLREEWQRADRYAMPLSLVFFDLDDFKGINDTLGHQAGDLVLREFATLVAGGARANDVAARYGGEEFAIILPHTEAGMAMRVADRIRMAVAEFTFLESERPTRVTVSVGVATWPSTADVDSMDGLLRAADRALYRAKDLGKNRVVQARDVPRGAVESGN